MDSQRLARRAEYRDGLSKSGVSFCYFPDSISFQLGYCCCPQRKHALPCAHRLWHHITSFVALDQRRPARASTPEPSSVALSVVV